MGNKIFNIQPVKSGKTASAIFKFLEDSRNTLFICKISIPLVISDNFF